VTPQELGAVLFAGGVLALLCTFGGACIGVWGARRERAHEETQVEPWPHPPPAPEPEPPPPAPAPQETAPSEGDRIEAISTRVRAALAVDADETGGIEIKPAVSALGDVIARLLGHYAASLQPEAEAAAVVRAETDALYQSAMRYCTKERVAQIAQAGLQAPQQRGRHEKVH
jgi:hypothetical protein